jgi:hypothetical protein
MSCESMYVKSIENGIRSLRIGTKKPEDVASSVSNSLSKLRMSNQHLAEDLMLKYDNVVNDYRNRTKNK